MRIIGLLCLMFAFLQPASAQTLNHPAENQVPVAVVKVNRTAAFTEVTLQATAPLTKVCWTSAGADSPYLLADGRRYRLLGGADITACPDRRDYAQGETMTLRFEPLPAQTRTVSLVEGKGGENQMADPASQPGIRYWNFLRINLN